MKHNVRTSVDAIEMQMELADLRKRVKILDGNTGRNELLTRLHEREEENKRAEQQLRILNDKFHQVHKGLVHIDEEREKLRIAKDQLEKEKKEIQRQLDIREKEVLLLARRCSSQEEKMRESAKLRVSNNELASEMEGLRTSLTMREEEISQIDSLKHELKECQDSRQGLLDRLNKVKKDHDDVVETLNSCFQNIQKLNQSNAELEEERKREMQRAQLELEQQRLSHLDIVNELRAEVQLRQDRIEQMEAILKENMTVCTSLRKERGEWNTKLQLELSKMKEEHATERSTLNSENDRLVQKLHDEYAIVLDEMRSKLEEKDGVVSSLEDEVSKYMKKIMALSTDLQNLREETSRAAAVQTEAIAELDTLTDLVCTRDEEIAKLSATITTLENEKESLSSELMDLRDRIKELEEENAFIMDLEDQLHDVNTSMIEVNEKKSLEREEYEMTVALLRQELDDERSMWASMEQGLHDKISALEENNQKGKQVANEALIEARQVLRSANTLSTTVEALRCSLKEVSWERETRQALEEDLKSLQLSLVESQNERVEERKRIEKLEAELANIRETSDHVASSSEERVSLLQEELSNMRELHEFKDQALESVQTELRDVRSAKKQEVSTLQEELKEIRSQLSKARISVGAEATASQRIMAEKDASIASLTSEIAVLKSEAAVQDRMLQNIESNHEKDLLKLMEDLEASRVALEHEKSERVKMSMASADALDAANTEITEGKEIICQQTTQIACLEVKLSEIRSSVEEQAATSGRSLASNEKELSLLQAEYDKLKCETLQMENEIREQLKSKEQELAYVYAQLKESSERFGQEEKSSEKTFKEKNEEIKALTAELEFV
jgi:chromosome segregation ATPase